MGRETCCFFGVGGPEGNPGHPTAGVAGVKGAYEHDAVKRSKIIHTPDRCELFIIAILFNHENGDVRTSCTVLSGWSFVTPLPRTPAQRAGRVLNNILQMALPARVARMEAQ